MGKNIALVLGRAGAKVAFNYFSNESAATETFNEFEAAGGQGILARGDASNEDDVARMVEEVVGSLGLPEELCDRIAIQTDGVPLFVEELTKSVLETAVGSA